MQDGCMAAKGLDRYAVSRTLHILYQSLILLSAMSTRSGKAGMSIVDNSIPLYPYILSFLNAAASILCFYTFIIKLKL
jgi:hypothetical protein